MHQALSLPAHTMMRVSPKTLKDHSETTDRPFRGAAAADGWNWHRAAGSWWSELRRLSSTSSPIQRLPAPERERVLDGVTRIAAEEFADRVERRMVTALYTARTNPAG